MEADVKKYQPPHVDIELDAQGHGHVRIDGFNIVHGTYEIGIEAGVSGLPQVTVSMHSQCIKFSAPADVWLMLDPVMREEIEDRIVQRVTERIQHWQLAREADAIKRQDKE